MSARQVTAAERYADVLARLAAAAQAVLLRLWDGKPGVPLAANWDEAARPLIEQIADAAVQAAVVLGAQFGATAAPSDLIVADAGARVLDPFDRIAALVKRGEFTGLDESARSVVEALAHDTVYRTARQAVASVAGEVDTAWVRRATAKSCDWCLSMTQYTYRSAESASFGHDRCDCVPMPHDWIGDHNDRIIADRGLTADGLEAQRTAADHRRKLRRSAAIAEKRAAETPERAADWTVRAERARERLAAAA